MKSSRSTSGAAHRLALRICSAPSAVGPVRRAVERFARAGGFDDRAAGEIGLCVNEALANVIRHAYANRPDRPIELHAAFTDAALCIHIRDWGSGVLPPPRPAAERSVQPGGLGLLCLHTLMDEVVYTAQDDGMLLTLTRRRPVTENQPHAARGRCRQQEQDRDQHGTAA